MDSTPEECRSLFVGDLSCFCTENDLAQLFKSFGVIKEIRLMRHKETNACLGYAFIIFNDQKSVFKAKELDGNLFLGRHIK